MVLFNKYGNPQRPIVEKKKRKAKGEQSKESGEQVQDAPTETTTEQVQQ
jgi:hypothetical protein